MGDAPREDHGEFKLQTSLNDDLKLIRKSEDIARTNPSKPGHHWQRMVARANDGPPLEIVKMYHVDLNAGVVEITETTNGEETARRTMKLEDLG